MKFAVLRRLICVALCFVGRCEFAHAGEFNLEQVTAEAEKGAAEAQFQLGKSYLHGEGVTKNETRARALLLQAAEQGHSMAQNHLGVMYLKGQGGKVDGEDGLKWLRLAAGQGNATAQNNLGLVLTEGTGGFEVGVDGSSVHVQHNCLGRSPAPMRRKALVAVLPSLPKTVFVSCGMDE